MLTQAGLSAFPPALANRAAWEAVAGGSVAREIVHLAELALATDPPPLGREDWERWWATGERLIAEGNHNRRRYRLVRQALAAALTGDRRFVAGAARDLEVILSEETWVLVAHDFDYRDDRVLDPDRPSIDLFSAMTCQALAEVDVIIGDLLPAELRARARAMVHKRGVGFFLARDDYRWERGQLSPNWAAVCAGAIGMAALHQESDADLLGRVMAKVERCFNLYFATFPADGGCLEGMGYWEKSMAYVAMLGDLIERHPLVGIARGWSPLNDPRVQAVASFPARVALRPGLFPAFSDTSPHRAPQAALLHFLARRLHVPALMTVSREDPANRALTRRPTGEQIRDLFWFAPEALDHESADTSLRGHDWLPETQWFVARDGASDVAFAIKGGHNSEPHNQNDVGSFVIALDGATPVAELGAPAYDRAYFTAATRYQSLAARSAGHSVPIVNGFEQCAGAEYRARDMAPVLSDGTAGVRLDLAGAYPAEAGLVRLDRTLTLTRGPLPVINLTDAALFEAPGDLSTVIVTRDPVRLLGDRAVLLGDAQDAIRTLTIGFDPERVALEILNDSDVALREGPATVTRLVFKCREPSVLAQIELVFSALVSGDRS